MQLSRNLYNTKKLRQIPTRNGYGEGLVEAGKKNEKVVVLCADLTESTRSHLFAEKFPERFIEVGIAEQNMAGIASGLAISGKIPFVSTYGVFCPGRNWDQVRVNICYNNANVKLTGAHTGVSVGPDGATHQALEDIAIMRCLPGMTVLAPCDYLETKKATMAAAKIKGPVYLRFAREATPVFTAPATPFKIGRAEIFREGKEITIVACGPLVYQALLAAEKLHQEKISVEVINSHAVKPLDVKTIVKSVKKTGAAVTAEDHQINGGLGSAVAEALAENYPVPLARVGMPDSFGESGPPQELLGKYGMTAPHIIKAVKKILRRKK